MPHSMNWKFELKDLDLDKLEKEVIILTDKLWQDGNGPQVNGRTKEQIYDNTYRGLAAEHYLIEHQGFSNNSEHCQDVIDPNGVRIEVKVTINEETMHKFVVPRLNRIKNWYPDTYPDIAYVFYNNHHRTPDEYEFGAVLTWDGKTFL